ncbi:unnamed protein product [Tilletia laevis]|uniref:m7GpppX diphosphatase n=3 Tax=Tilletia TaxID=13289 RepID=A0A9N8QB72_9BASI|nr:hypothetical protein CF335_g7330 [Tilletia laevis]CAD6884692.1 unnamed protein product [Tilletia caries]KAE8196235.1 hypothetical protein CF336_g2725 [Tilletia laevis]CAD6911507.1 unnamed protein product [Tilletia caries]CAD6919840.1 unnamed protein product [Tilletia laevis]
MEEVERPASLVGFRLERILNQDARIHSASLLGSMPPLSTDAGTDREQVILNIEKTHFSNDFYAAIGGDASPSTADSKDEAFARLSSLGQNDVYTWLVGWLRPPSDSADGTASDRGADVKMTLIRPVTETHILKYSAQDKYLFRETPEVYEGVVKPWIRSQPASRINWVYNILDKLKEKDSIIYEEPSPESGFIIVPDLKWDQQTLSSLYLVAIVHNRSLRSLRDLRREHVPMLRAIGHAAERVAKDRYGVKPGMGGGSSSVRCFLHYQPTYYHLHVHILHASHVSYTGAIVGQAHLLDDVIDLLELGVDFGKRTLTYALGERHELWGVLADAKVLE